MHLTAGLSTVIMLLPGGLHPLPGGRQVAYWAVLGQDWWIRDPMNQHSDAVGTRLPWFSTATERHSGYWPAPAWDQAVGRAAGL